MYMMVLGCTLAVSVVGLSSLALLRVQRRWAAETADFAQARLHARSAIEMGLYHIQANANWRSAFPSGLWETNRSVGTGRYSLMGVDPADNDLADSFMDPVVLTGIGQERATLYKLQVTLTADPVPLSCLEVSMHANSNLIFNSPATVNGAQIISANNTIHAVGACTINPNCESVNGFTGAVGPGSTTSGISPRAVPDPSTVFEHYVANGTAISPPSYMIEQVVLSPNSNPYGPATNALGIYILDAQGQNVIIRNCRIVGTLVVLNPGSSSEVRESVLMEPAVANYPVLLLGGSFRFGLTNSALSEATFINFNPPGTPSEGVEDSDRLDTYPSVLKGLVYASGSVSSSGHVTIDGTLILGGSLDATDTVDLTYRDIWFNDPPPGFEASSVMVVSPGTWQQTTN